MSGTYDPPRLAELAARMRWEAGRLLVTYVLGGMFVLAVVGAVLGQLAGVRTFASLVIFVIIGGVFGYFVGSARALEVRLRAEMVLCLMAIEANTRR
jgi:hypothetical protein